MRDAINDAKEIVKKHYPNCDGALLAGSVVRGTGTETSDLDIVIYDGNFESGFRESVVSRGWPVEFFCHNKASLDFYFAQDKEEGTPSLQKMVTEGVIIKDHPFLHTIKEEAQKQLDQGPDPWTDLKVEMARYFITDTLDDIIGSKDAFETLCSVNLLYERLFEFYLGINRQWRGHGKWMHRAMMAYDSKMALLLYEAFEQFYVHKEIKSVVEITDLILKPVGGRHFDGFTVGKK